MKAKFLLVLAAAAMLFTACTKEKIHKNEITWNGITRPLNSSVGIYHNGTEYSISGFTTVAEEADHPEYTFDCEIAPEGLNKTFDLTQGPITDNTGFWIWFNAHALNKHDSFTNRSGEWYGNLNTTQFENTSIFKSGTMTITLDDEGMTLSLDGVLKDDDTITVDLFIPNEKFTNR